MNRNDIKRKNYLIIGKVKGEFYSRPFGQGQTAKVPKQLFEEYQEIRGAYLLYREQIEKCFQPIKVNPGEVHKL